tara:strand:- start:1327 stop:1785 length:459 start_codon:yes stop_codon:yes gene_type:complete
MLKLPETITQIKRYHAYNHVSKTSDWTKGLKHGKMRGSELDTLRNNMSNENWEWLMATAYTAIDADAQRDQPNNIPKIKADQFEERTEELYNTTITHNSFSEECNSKGSSDFKALLWSILNVCMEILEYVEYELPEYNSHNEFDNKLFDWGV